MRAFLTVLLVLGISSHAQAQYQKMSKANSINLSGFTSYANLAWSKQLTNRNSITVGGFYFQDETNFITTNNYGTEVNFNRWLFRVDNAYLSAGAGLFFAHTEAKSVASAKADDNTFGNDLRVELEYYPAWWLVVFGEIKQLIFFNSDFFNSKFIAGGGIKIVF